MKKLLKISLTLVITAIFVTGIIMPELILGTPASPAVGNWYQQFLPNLQGRTISDIFFLDSLTGWAVTGTGGSVDSAYILKTTNKGDTWQILYFDKNSFTRIKFINTNTGYTSGATPFIGASSINKTTNGGLNWFIVPPPGSFFYS